MRQRNLCHEGNTKVMIKRKKRIIEARNIDKSFDGLKVLDKVSLSLNEGETLGIAGASGSGKSTLSKILVGIMEPDSGEVLFRNELLPVVGKKRRDTSKYPIQMVFQNSKAAFDPSQTIGKSLSDVALRYEKGFIKSENGVLAKSCRTRAIKESVSEKIKELLVQCELAPDLLERYPEQLSGGQLQRMAICRAMLTEPKVLVADEIISALDIPVQLEVMRILKKMIKKNGMTLIFISHDLNAIAMMTEKTMVLSEGKLEFYDETGKLWESENEVIKELITASRVISV